MTPQNRFCSKSGTHAEMAFSVRTSLRTTGLRTKGAHAKTPIFMRTFLHTEERDSHQT